MSTCLACASLQFSWLAWHDPAAAGRRDTEGVVARWGAGAGLPL